MSIYIACARARNGSHLVRHSTDSTPSLSLFPSQLTMHGRIVHASLLRGVLQLSFGCNPAHPANSHPSATAYFLEAPAPCSDNLQRNRRSRVTQMQPVPGTHANCAEKNLSGGPGKLRRTLFHFRRREPHSKRHSKPESLTHLP